MNKMLIYIIESGLALAILYLVYRFLFYKENYHNTGRAVLISIVIFSCLLPFLRFTVPINIPVQNEWINTIVEPADQPATILAIPEASFNPLNNTDILSNENKQSLFTGSTYTKVEHIFLQLFVLISILLFIRILIMHFRIILFVKSGKVLNKSGNVKVIHVDKKMPTFSYFNYVILNTDNLSKKEINKIIAHERVHIEQKHTLDILLLECFGLFQWFNPFYWLLRKSLKETHEFLADEGVLNQGIDPTDYQVLLLKQVAEGPVIALTCNLNESLTKKRIIMMQRNKKSGKRSIAKLIGFVPALIMLVILFSCKPKTTLAQEQMAAVSLTKMNVLYLGVDNPVDIVVSNTSPENIYVECSNGQIVGENGIYIVNPRRVGNAIIKVYAINKKDTTLVKQTEFRVKTLPMPVAKVAGRKSGAISKEELLKAEKVYVVMENSEYDMRFEIIEFKVVAVIEGFVRDVLSKGADFSEDQRNIMRDLKTGNQIYIQDIKAAGPDGTVRELGTIAFKIQ